MCKQTCDWKPVHSFGKDAAGGRNVGTAVAVSGVTTYAAWVDSGANPSPTFASGIDTNYGGTWHRITSPVLPDAPGDGLAVVGGSLVLATDVGVFTASTSTPARWSRVAGLPNVVVDNVRTQPGSTDTVLLATHGRGPVDGATAVRTVASGNADRVDPRAGRDARLHPWRTNCSASAGWRH